MGGDDLKQCRSLYKRIFSKKGLVNRLELCKTIFKLEDECPNGKVFDYYSQLLEFQHQEVANTYSQTVNVTNVANVTNGENSFSVI